MKNIIITVLSLTIILLIAGSYLVYKGMILVPNITAKQTMDATTTILINTPTATNTDLLNNIIQPTSTPQLAATTTSAPETEKNNLIIPEGIIGCFYDIKNQDVKIALSRKGNFIFQDYYNLEHNIETFMSGSYTVNNYVLTLLYSDRPKQNFYFGRNAVDGKYFIKNNSGYFLSKGSCDDFNAGGKMVWRSDF